jgi:dTMP kinase
MYVVIEGVDTAGKSTQLDILKRNHPDAVFTKEPGGTPLGLKLRQMALNAEAQSDIAEMFLFLADRAEHLKQIIQPNLHATIISDRSMISGIAYALCMPIEIVTTLNLIATSNTLPTHVVLLELSQEELHHRLSQKEHDGIESRGVEYLLEIQNRMKQTIEKLNINHRYIDASLSIETISKQIQEFIHE